MCGITGFLASPSGGPHRDQILSKMTDALSHRGPDGGGTWQDSEAGVYLGHRRLAILDLSAEANQPMVSADNRYVIVYNGETYNFREIRAALEANGHAFHTESDTEVLLAGFSRWGIWQTLERSVGMAAMAVWDRQENVLTLARDRFGEKPLYYGHVGSDFVFASELKAIIGRPDFAGRLDPHALQLYFRHAYIPAPECIWAGIRKLPPGHILEIRPGAAVDKAKPEPYWSTRTAAACARQSPYTDSDAAVDALETLLRRTIRDAMVSDVPLGIFLSGGIDSTLVTALAQAESPGQVRTFTIGFEEGVFDEAADARAIASHLKTDHTEFIVKGDDAIAVIPKLSSMYGEPFADSSQIPTHLVSKLARQHVTVALSGDGGDELFAGYNRHVDGAVWIDRLMRLPAAPRARIGKWLASAPPDRLESLGRLFFPRTRAGRFAEKATKLGEALQQSDAYTALTSCWADYENPADTHELAPAARHPAEGFSTLDEMLLRDTEGYLHDDVLTKVDRASMAVGLEVRAPLLSHKVFEAAWRLPAGQRVHNGHGKHILRTILARHVPPALTNRPKTGFAIPLDDWLRGPLRAWADELLSPEALASSGHIDPAPVLDVWQQHLAGRRNAYHRLWAVLMFQSWYQTHRHIIEETKPALEVSVHG